MRVCGKQPLAVCLLLVVTVQAANSAAAVPDGERTVRCRNGAVVCVNGLAADIGLEVLKQGGNAVDAAVATAFALAVTHPAAGNIGGGGYMLVVPAGGSAPLVFDFREVAPDAATRDMFVDPAGRTPHRRSGVPGTVRGLAMAHERLGSRPWNTLVMPAVALARDGFALDEATATSLNEVLNKSDKTKFAELHRVYGRADKKDWRAGDRLTNPDLAETLEQIARQGPDAFYLGVTAEKIAAEMQRGGGLITPADLAGYRPIVREAVRGTYRGYEIVGAPPSSSGGTTLIEELNILEPFDLRAKGRWSAETLHLIIEAAKRSYRDRACYLGDPDSNTIPDKLTSKSYARELANDIDLARATPSLALAGEIPITPEGDQTTHLSVIDRNRTAVSLTYTLESAYGSRVVVSGAGFILNDEMNDFAWLPGVTNQTGRIGTAANQIAPGKRMLSSMCPTVVLREGQPFLITGSPGGRTIINTVLCVVVNVIDFQMDVRAAVDAPRLHHQWLPDVVKAEPGLMEQHAAVVGRLRTMGHSFGNPARQGDAHSIWIDPASGEIVGAADGRVSGKAAGY